MRDNLDTEIIANAEFKSSVIIYSWILTNIVLLTTVVGIIIMLLWIPFGWFVHLKQFQNTSKQVPPCV